MTGIAALHRTLDQELVALLRGRIESNVLQVQFGSQAG